MTTRRRQNTEFTALIVDGNSISQANAKKYLTKNGFEVKVAENGKEAVDYFHGGNQFDLVMMDLEMPIMNGIEATKEIRAMGIKSLIIGMKACSSPTMIQEFHNSGLDDFLPKPMNMAKLIAILAHLK